MLTNVDRIIVLNDGRIAQQGPPDRLIGEPGYFQDMMRGRPGRASARASLVN
jgi:ABC-type multidrug transport system fused ATPase/permease subunit